MAGLQWKEVDQKDKDSGGVEAKIGVVKRRGYPTMVARRRAKCPPASRQPAEILSTLQNVFSRERAPRRAPLRLKTRQFCSFCLLWLKASPMGQPLYIRSGNWTRGSCRLPRVARSSATGRGSPLPVPASRPDSPINADVAQAHATAAAAAARTGRLVQRVLLPLLCVRRVLPAVRGGYASLRGTVEAARDASRFLPCFHRWVQWRT